MCRTVMASGSDSAHYLAAPSLSALECASNVSLNPKMQLPAPNGSVGHTRGPANGATARWKALANAVMPGTKCRTTQTARPKPLDLTVCPTQVTLPLSTVPRLRDEDTYHAIIVSLRDEKAKPIAPSGRLEFTGPVIGFLPKRGQLYISNFLGIGLEG